jgi:hypothetical protein
MSFSKRMGLQEPKDTLQLESMDDDLRVRLWNALCFHYWDNALYRTPVHTYAVHENMNALVQAIWREHFILRTDSISTNWSIIYQNLATYFFEHANWHQTYDFIEFVPNNYRTTAKTNDIFRFECNLILEKEFSGYRFIGEIISPISNTIEMQAITEATDSKFQSSNIHIENALRLFSDKKAPDYRNTIKESISAVEAVCRQITKESTLDRSLNKIQNKIHINDQFKQGLEKIYHYTNGPDGIRHALLEDGSQADFEEAKFMLVTCSAFVNFLAGKDSKNTL